MINIILLAIVIILFYIILYINYRKETFKQKRRFLLFSSIGKRDTDVQALDLWTKSNYRNYDIVLYYYKEKPPKNCRDYCIYRKDTKLKNFYHFMTNYDISNYEAIWIVDDDIKMETKEINKMFNIFKKYNLDLAQPSYTENSVISHPITEIDRTCKLRYSNFVEIGAVIWSQKMIHKFKDLFKNTNSTCGIDFIACKQADNGKNIALIDETPCLHGYIKSSLDNVMPRKDQWKEGEELYKKYKIWPYKQKIYKKI